MATPILNSQFGKPNNLIRFKSVTCVGNEMKLIDCSTKQLSIYQGRKQLNATSVAGVDCIYDVPTEPPCIQRPDSYGTPGSNCTSGSIRLIPPGVGRLEYCYNGYWSPFCKLDPVAASLACQYLGYNDYTC